jgi:Glycosyl transferase family 2/GtrA-like protein
MTGLVHATRVVARTRVSRFIVVGTICAGCQLVVNYFLLAAGAPGLIAFVLSFLGSAQLNFVLSDRFTWAARRNGAGARWSVVGRWASYNLSTLASLAVSSTTFVLASTVFGNNLAVLCGISAGALLTYVAGDRLVFASKKGDATGVADANPAGSGHEAAATDAETQPPDRDKRSTTLDSFQHDQVMSMLGRGIAVFLPSYNESENLPVVVRRVVKALEDIGAPYRVIIVNDGSHDQTQLIADELAEIYFPNLSVVTHDRNLGYGNALRSGFAAGLAEGMDWVAFLDSDNQFSPEQIKDLVATAFSQHVDLVAGYRIKRADGFARRLNGRMWHVLSRVVLGIRERDVDCGFKLVHRNILEAVELHGTYAAVSPELLAKARRAGFRSAEVGVNHYPRIAGEQTGANLKVIVRSLISILRLRASLSRSARSDSHDGVGSTSALGMGLVATTMSIISFLFFYSQDQTLLYDDSISHLLIAGRVVDGVTPGLAQLGSVWLPLPHILVAPFIWIDSMFYSGVAGSLISMVSFVVAAVMLFKTAYLMTGSVLGAWVAGLVFTLNPNMLFLQSTPMTETLLFACMAAAVYQLTLWSHSGRWQNLGAAAAMVFLASLARYEGWVLLGAFVLAVVFISARRSHSKDRITANLTFFGALAAAGVAAWLLWNKVIFGSFTDFATGEFSKPSLWVSESDQAVGNLPISLQTYVSAITGTVGLPLVLIALGGLVVYLLNGRLRPESVAPLTLLIFLPFFVFALVTGQRPLHVVEISGDLYNTRFGLVMLLPAALFAAYLVVATSRWIAGTTQRSNRERAQSHREPESPRFAAVALVSGTVLLIAGGTLISGGVLTLEEPRNWSANRVLLTPAAQALRDVYDGGLLLMQGFGNEYVEFTSRVPTNQIIYEGSYLRWEPALRDPAGENVEWIYLSRSATDLVWGALGGSPELTDYEVRFDDGIRVIYQRR